MRDPEGGDFRPLEGSAAQAYGSYSHQPAQPAEPEPCLPPPAGEVLSGAVIQVGGVVDGPTTWNAGLVRVVAPVVVEASASLTVTPGTRVEFEGFFNLLVHGRLWAVGEPGRRIVFAPAPQQAAEGWDGIDFINAAAGRDTSRLEHCLITGAVARPAGGDDPVRIVGGTHRPETGGAIAVVGGGKVSIVSCVLENNHAQYGGAVYCSHGASPVLAGNLLAGNTAAWRGSALFNVYAFPKLANNTIVNNSCLNGSEFYLCGAVDNFNGKIALQNNIIRANPTPHYSQGQVIETKDHYTWSNNIEFYEGNPSNLDADALFLAAGSHPWQLTEGSPCRDRGMGGGASLFLGPFDLAGQPRWAGGALDLGAYEFSGTFSPAGDAPGAGPALSCAPNPFNPRTGIRFELPREGRVGLRVYDLRGRLVRRLHEGLLPAGSRTLVWDGKDDRGKAMPTGVYVIGLDLGRQTATVRATLLR